MSQANVSFEVVLQTAGSGLVPTVENVDKFKPDPERLEVVRRWLWAHGVVSQASGFGLACSATAETFEKLFGARLHPLDRSTESMKWRIEGRIRVPEEIAALVEDVSISREPEFF